MAAWWRRTAKPEVPSADVQWQRLSADVEAAREERLTALAGQESLVDELTATLFRVDPIGLNFETNTDEYASEAQSIALRLPGSGNLDEICDLVYEEFVAWFDVTTAGNPATYGPVGQAVMAVWNKHHPLGVPATLRVVADYDCWPLWDPESVVNVDPHALPITRRLADRLVAWSDRYTASLNRADPATTQMTHPEEFYADGRVLADLLSAELADISTIVYAQPEPGPS